MNSILAVLNSSLDCTPKNGTTPNVKITDMRSVIGRRPTRSTSMPIEVIQMIYGNLNANS
jgi:hypothetical protein